MKKKFYYLFLALLFIASRQAFSQNDYIMWIADTKMDSGFVELLEDNDYNVIVNLTTYQGVLDQQKLDSLDKATLIVLSRTCNSKEYADSVSQWNNTLAPIILMSPWLARNNRMKWFDTETIDTVVDKITPYDAADPIFKDLTTTGPLDVYIPLDSVEVTGSEIMGVSEAGNGNVISQSTKNSNVAMVSWNSGTEYYTGAGQYAGGKRIFFPAGSMGRSSEAGQYNLSADGEKMFLNAVAQFFSDEPSSIDDLSRLNNDVKVYADPNSQTLNIDLQSDSIDEDLRIYIYSVIGTKIYDQTFEQASSVLTIDVAGVQTGIYLVRIQGKKINTTKKVRVN